MQKIVLQSEYGLSGLWIDDGSGLLEVIELEDLQVSGSLKRELLFWNDLFHSQFIDNKYVFEKISYDEWEDIFQLKLLKIALEIGQKLKKELGNNYQVEVRGIPDGVSLNNIEKEFEFAYQKVIAAIKKHF